MTSKIRYTNEPIGNPKVVRDFLPSPEKLAFREEDVKVTITLSRKIVSGRGARQHQPVRSTNE